MSKAGRKNKFSIELLQENLSEYVKNHPNVKIKFSNLEKFTGIPYHVWRDNVEIRNLINSLNNPNQIIDTTGLKFELPTAKEIVDNNYPDRAKLEGAIADLLNLTSSLYDKAVVGENFEAIEQGYKVKIAEIEANYKILLDKANEEIKKLNHEIDCLYLDSRNSLTRNQKGIKDNLIILEDVKQKSLSKNIADIEDEFSGLFD